MVKLYSKLVQYYFARLGRDKMSTYATKVIQSPNASIRAIWVPKSIVTNVVGSTRVGHQKMFEKAFRYMEMHWRVWYIYRYCIFKLMTKSMELSHIFIQYHLGNSSSILCVLVTCL